MVVNRVRANLWASTLFALVAGVAAAAGALEVGVWYQQLLFGIAAIGFLSMFGLGLYLDTRFNKRWSTGARKKD